MTTKRRRHKGEGSITELAKGKYKVTFTVGYDANGKQIRKSYTASTKRECLDKIDEWKREINGVVTSRNTNVTLRQYMAHYLEYKKTQVRYSTYYAYKCCSKYVLEDTLSSLLIHRVTTRHLNDFILRISPRYKPSTRQQYWILLNDLFKLALSEGLVKTNPMQNAIRVRRTNHVLDRDMPTRKDIDRLLSKAREAYHTKVTGIYKYTYHILLLALSTGMRRGEIVALQWSALDRKKNIITVNRTAATVINREIAAEAVTNLPKTNSSFRQIKVSREVVDCIYNEVERLNDFVFASPTKEGSHIHPVSITHVCKQLMCTVGLDDYHFHDLRHIYATSLISKGVDTKTVSKRLGHSDVSITLGIYTHVIPEMDEKAADVMGKDLLLE